MYYKKHKLAHVLEGIYLRDANKEKKQEYTGKYYLKYQIGNFYLDIKNLIL